MKKWGFLLCLLSCAYLTINTIFPFLDPKVEIQKVDEEDKSTSEKTNKKEITEKQIHQGNLILVNHEYPVDQESIKSDIINLYTHSELTQGYGLMDRNIYLSKDIAIEFSTMIAAAKKEGVRHFSITSGFRDFEEQGVLYQEIGSDYALPAGFSEHNLGLALDVGSTQMKMAVALEGKWIEKNAWKYGFVLRYPKDKKDITGIEYEPWHIRYVGLPHSAIMKKKGFVLEEYLEFLRDEKHISVKVDGKEYSITYYPISGSGIINVPHDSHCEISGNNMDGVMVTVYE